MWPIYTVQKTDNGALLYPMAGIRVPGAANVFNFLAQPSGNTLTPSPKCIAPGCIPTMSNSPWSGTKLDDGMIAQWMTCTLAPTSACRMAEIPIYADVNHMWTAPACEGVEIGFGEMVGCSHMSGPLVRCM
jgi:hypothetical protein